MANGYFILDDQWIIWALVQDAVILYTDFFSDDGWGYITANDGIEPD
jgi:hypothetical protein